MKNPRDQQGPYFEGSRPGSSPGGWMDVVTPDICHGTGFGESKSLAGRGLRPPAQEDRLVADGRWNARNPKIANWP
jgi:hypothetical protein